MKYFRIIRTWSVKAEDEAEALRQIAAEPTEHLESETVARTEYIKKPRQETGWAAGIRSQWSDPASPFAYPINQDDNARGIGPLMGRYPDDHYDGNSAPPNDVGHPWVPCTANFAELYYRLATTIRAQQTVPLDALSAPFFTPLGIDATTPADTAADVLDVAGDRMLRALILHSDRLELSEQFDRTTGFEKSVANLTWSYAAFLSAVRIRTGAVVHG